MNIAEYCDVINKNIKVTYYHNQNTRWTACIERAEVKDGNFLTGMYGDGKTPYNAIENYIANIKGKTIVFDAYDKEKRIEYKVPETLTIINTIY